MWTTCFLNWYHELLNRINVNKNMSNENRTAKSVSRDTMKYSHTWQIFEVIFLGNKSLYLWKILFFIFNSFFHVKSPTFHYHFRHPIYCKKYSLHYLSWETVNHVLIDFCPLSVYSFVRYQKWEFRGLAFSVRYLITYVDMFYEW